MVWSSICQQVYASQHLMLNWEAHMEREINVPLKHPLLNPEESYHKTNIQIMVIGS